METLKAENIQLEKENLKLKSKIANFDKIVFNQNRYASMGEMIDTIAHQWRQPLTEISSLFMIHEINAKKAQVDNTALLESIESLNELTSYMSNTIEDFRKFLSKTKKEEEFYLAHSINDVVKLLSGSISKNNIKVDIVIKRNTLVKGVKNEFSQALMNIISNAKDVLIEKKISEPRLKITLKEDQFFSILSVEDNALGIDIVPIEKVFEPFFTKDKKNGTGVGLFLSKLIIEDHMDGKIKVCNTDEGARFDIYIKKFS